MEIKQVTRKHEKKIKRLSLKTTKTGSEWMTSNNVSPQLIFDLALEELMEKGQ